MPKSKDKNSKPKNSTVLWIDEKSKKSVAGKPAIKKVAVKKFDSKKNYSLKTEISENNTNTATTKQILSVEKLNKFFAKSGKLVQVLDDIEFNVNEKDFFGIIGESGSGKSTTGKCIIRLYSSSSGIVTFNNRIINQSNLTFSQKIGHAFNLLASPADEMSRAMHRHKLQYRDKTYSKERKTWLYKNMSMIFQDPMSSLNPRKNVLSLVSEPLVINKTIKNDVDALIKIYAETNPYFQNTYKTQDAELVKKYQIPFYQKNIEMFKKQIELVNAIEVDLSNTNNLLNVIADSETDYKNSLKNLYTFVKNIKNMIYKNNRKLLTGHVHPTETAYYAAEKQLEQETKNLELPIAYWELKTKIESKQNALNTYIQRQKAVYEFQNLPRFRSILDSLKSEIKAMKQESRLTHSITDHLFKKTDIFIKNDTHKALSEVIATYGAGVNAYFEYDEMQAFCDFVFDRIRNKYATLTLDTSNLVSLSEKIDALSIKDTQPETIIPIANEYQNTYDRILKELVVLKETNFVEADIELRNAIDKIVKRSFEIKEKITKKIEQQQAKIVELLHAMDECKKEYEKNKLKTSPEHQVALENFEKAKSDRKTFVDEDNKDFNENHLPAINQLFVQAEQLDDELYYIHKQFVSVVKKKTKAFTTLLRQNPDHNPEKVFKETLERWLKAFSSEEKAKRSTIDIFERNVKNSLVSIGAVNFEITTSLETIALSRKLRTLNKATLLSCKPALSTLITRDYVYKALDEVGLKTEHAYRYPHEFSGGQRQRIVIARALISKPKLIIADEPISALDVSIQAQVINIMRNLAKKYNITFIFIAHDLSMVRYVSNRLIIMHRGKIVEKGFTDEVFKNPVHPYTKSLIKASPELSKIHVDLASFSAKLDYDKNYTINNRPEYFSMSDTHEHFVFATKDQIKKWKK